MQRTFSLRQSYSSIMDSDQSYSGDSNSSSGSSSGSSEDEEEVLEPVKILGHRFELPQDLCEDPAIFREFFSMDTWNELDPSDQEHLKQFLPNFPVNNENEQDTTIRMLFNREPFHFSTPLNDFYYNLRQGNYRPDIAKMKKFLVKARKKQQKQKVKSYFANLLPEVLISRERLIKAAKCGPPGPIPRIPSLPPKPSDKNNYKPPHIRSKHRYFEELAAIRSEVGGGVESEDENYPEGPPIPAAKRKKLNLPQTATTSDGNVSGTLGGCPSVLTSMDCLKNVLAAHKVRRRYKEVHPELDTEGITLDEVKQRTALVIGPKKLMFGGVKHDTPVQKPKRVPKKETTKCSNRSIKKEPAHIRDSIDKKPLLPEVEIKREKDSDTETSSFLDTVTSPRGKKRRNTLELDKNRYSYMDRKFDSLIKEEPLESILQIGKACQPIKLEDLDGIDMMALPVELADEEKFNPFIDPDESLTETTYANFLCLVRALFPAKAAHRASKAQIHARCSAVMRSPIAPLNSWYSQASDWCSELDSALEFLAGERGPHPEDFVPYLQFIPETQMYQWIGAGRDGDAILGRLCDRWMRSTSPLPPPNEPPPPRFPTSWVVRPATSSEIAEFRSQERRRFSSAAKPFTYVLHGYRAVVGGCARAPVACSAHAALLVPDRPRHATFMALVRDAVARLPNGEGTRHDILILLKMSQYLLPNNDQVLLSAVSASLDRLHAVKRDPVIKYDQRTAIWTYLHRNRTEEEWLKSSGRSRGAKSAANMSFSSKEYRPLTPPGMDLEVANVEEVIDDSSDVEIDVDDVTSLPNLSSAQLLMQANQANKTKQVIPPRPNKGKLVPAPPPKAMRPPPIPLPRPPRHTTKLTEPHIAKPANSSRSRAAKPRAPPKKAEPKSPAKPKTESPKSQEKKTTPTKGSNAKKEAPPPPPPPATTNKSPLIKQRPLQKQDKLKIEVPLPVIKKQEPIAVPAASPTSVPLVPQGTRSLLIRAPSGQINTTATVSLPAQVAAARRGMLRVLSPAAPSTGKSLISPRALMQQVSENAAKSRVTVVTSTVTATTAASIITTAATTTVVSTAPTVVTSPIATRTVQIGGRTVQLTPNQTVHIQTPVQLSTGHTLQLQIPTHSVRLPSGQTVQLAAPQAIRTVPGSAVKAAPNKTPNANPQVQIPVSAVQIAGQTVQIAGQIKLPSGQSVQVSNQSVQNLLSSGQTVQIPSAQGVASGVQLGGQTVQISGQTLQLSGQTLQLAGGQTLQLAGQTLQLAAQKAQQAARAAVPADKATGPIVAKLLTNAQGQMISLEGVMGGRTIQLAGIRPPGHKTLQNMAAVGGVRVVTSSGARMTRPLLVTAAKPLHNIILQQQNEGGTIRVPASGATTSQAIVISNIGAQTVTTSTTSPPVIKLQQVSPLQHVKLPQGIKIQQPGTLNIATAGGAVRSVLMDGQQLKLLGGRQFLARFVRPPNPPQ